MHAYASPASMEPLLPVAGRDMLAKLTCEILAASGRLTGQLHADQKAPEVLLALPFRSYKHDVSLFEAVVLTGTAIRRSADTRA